MKLEDFNLLLSELDANPGREQVMNTALAFLEWIGIKPAKDGKGKLLAPKKEELKKYLTRHPVTNQFQLYKLSAEDEAITVRFAFLKKFRKDQITQLIDKESIVHFQGAPPIIQTLPSAPAYTFHIVATAEQDRLYVILNKGDQKRIVSFRRKLTQTQFQKIVPQWQGLGTKSKPEIAEAMWKSLDIKEVNKEFYKQIKEQFDALVGIAKTQAPKTNEEEAKQFAVRLIGRYIFCWFLKEKGIISETLLASATIRQHKKDFFQKYLYQLFFNTLNEEVPSRNPFKGEGGLEELYDTIPYLNGGLFEKHPEDKLFGVLDLNAWLVAFVHVLEDFDFTVDESSSQYQQVAIDPEMLGRIFENLLASQNPETEKMANQRKAFGAFYTPREIVDYMVNQALKSYLEEALLPKDESTAVVEEPLVEYKGTLFQDMEPRQTLINFDPAKKAIADQRRKRLQEHLDKFFNPDCASHPFDKGDVPLVQQKLSEVKILDPACGSGAFPMGVLLRLMELRQLVGHGHRNNYDLKSEILSRNIYGVDIMPMAVEIARLRAWLSLVLEADYKPQDRKNNFGVSALPNLDFKFVCANSLINVPEDEYVTNMAVNDIALFERLTSQYFSASRHEKVTLKDQIKDTINSITQIHDIAIDRLKLEVTRQQKSGDKGKVKKMLKSQEDFEKQHKLWQSYKNIFENKTVGFFTTRYFFPSVKNGFDVVIGNPPYVQMQKDEGKLAEELKDAEYETYERTGDVYAIFYELGFKLLKPAGTHAFITSSQWLKANYGKSLRRFFLKKNLVELIELGPGIFESATVDTNILIARNEPNRNSLKAAIVERPEQIENLKGLTFQSIAYLTENAWAILNPAKQGIRQKIKSKGKPLSQWDIQINRGILTGYNEAFIVDEEKRNELISIDSKSKEILKPVLRGREIESYYTVWDGGYLINTHNGIKSKKITAVDVSKYPAIKRHLVSFGKKVIDRQDQGDTPYNLRNCAYLREFVKEKIIWKRIGSNLRFSYSNEEIFCLDSTCIATGEKTKYLTALLNSSLCNYQLFENAPKTGMGDLIISVQALEPLMVYYPTDKEEKIIVELVDQILKLKKSNKDTTDLERRIDMIVYKFYDLTYSEAKIVDPEFWLSEEEYNNYKVE